MSDYCITKPVDQLNVPRTTLFLAEIRRVHPMHDLVSKELDCQQSFFTLRAFRVVRA